MLKLPMRLRRLLWILGLLVVVLGAGAVHAAAPSQDDLGKWKADAEDLFATLTEPQRRQLERVLHQLRQADSDSADWDRMTAGLRIEVPRIDWEEGLEDPDALARGDPRRSQTVRVNQLMFARLTDHAHAAARYFIADMTGSDLSAVRGPVFDHLAVETHYHVLAWVFAHEVAHLRFGHPTRRAASLAELRDRELLADSQAFRLLNRAGYSIPLLLGYFEFAARLEAARTSAGRQLDETLMSHPTWARRRSSLQAFLRSNPAPRQRWIIYSTLAPSDAGPMKRTYLLPGDGTSLGLVFFEGQSPTPAGVEYLPDGQGAVFYERYSDANLTSRFQSVDAHFTYLTVSRSSGTGPGMKGVTTAFRDSFSGTSASDEMGFIASAMQTTSLGPLLQALDKVTADRQSREAGRRLYRARAKALDHANLRFFKSELSQEQLVAEQQRIMKQYAPELEQALGRSTVEAVDAEVARWAREMTQRRFAAPAPSR